MISRVNNDVTLRLTNDHTDQRRRPLNNNACGLVVTWSSSNSDSSKVATQVTDRGFSGDLV